jgi:hypothetical protein
MKKFIDGNFKEVGVNRVNLDEVAKDWKKSRTWSLIQYWNDFTLIKGVRKDSELTKFKTQISPGQAHFLIEVIGLQKIKSNIFNGVSTWKLLKET